MSSLAAARLAALCLLVVPCFAFAEQPLPHYPGTTLTRIGEDLLIQGEHYRLAYFVTKDPIHQVLRHFADEWAQQGISTMVDQNGSTQDRAQREAVISAFFTREGLVRSVVLLPHGKKTLGFSVLKDLWVREDVKAAPLQPLEGALWFGDVQSRDAAASGFHRTTLVEEGLSGARDQVVKTLKESGWKPVSEADVKGTRPGQKSRVLIHARGAEEVVTTLSETEPGVTAVTQALLVGPAQQKKGRGR